MFQTAGGSPQLQEIFVQLGNIRELYNQIYPLQLQPQQRHQYLQIINNILGIVQQVPLLQPN